MIYEITTLELIGLTAGALAVGYVIGFVRSAVKVNIMTRKFTANDVIPSHLIVKALMVARDIHRDNLMRECRTPSKRTHVGTINIEEEK
jgi:hypothetical protein